VAKESYFTFSKLGFVKKNYYSNKKEMLILCRFFWKKERMVCFHENEEMRLSIDVGIEEILSMSMK
jgi:hypothetical protein